MYELGVVNKEFLENFLWCFFWDLIGEKVCSSRFFRGTSDFELRDSYKGFNDGPLILK